ncbi:hypothetical protein BH24ACT12_BH24ACT12_28620 [soil metagenome]|jgi:hypothetical protein
MAFRLIESAQHRWLAVNAPPPRPRRRATFEKGNSSNDPTNQELISKSSDTPIHRSKLCLLTPGQPHSALNQGLAHSLRW